MSSCCAISCVDCTCDDFKIVLNSNLRFFRQLTLLDERFPDHFLWSHKTTLRQELTALRDCKTTKWRHRSWRYRVLCMNSSTTWYPKHKTWSKSLLFWDCRCYNVELCGVIVAVNKPNRTFEESIMLRIYHVALGADYSGLKFLFEIIFVFLVD